jgi:hypothetical protein
VSTQTLERPAVKPSTESGRVTHIVKKTDKKSAQALVMEAMVEGLEVEALCGHRWVPSRDPKRYPVCQGCEEIYWSNVPADQGLPGV